MLADDLIKWGKLSRIIYLSATPARIKNRTLINLKIDSLHPKNRAISLRLFSSNEQLDSPWPSVFAVTSQANCRSILQRHGATIQSPFLAFRHEIQTSWANKSDRWRIICGRQKSVSILPSSQWTLAVPKVALTSCFGDILVVNGTGKHVANIISRAFNSLAHNDTNHRHRTKCRSEGGCFIDERVSWEQSINLDDTAFVLTHLGK